MARAKWFDVWSWPLALAEEARAWWIFRRVSRTEASEKRLAECVPSMRVDNLGRIYTVVNVPEEMRAPDKESMHIPYVVDKLGDINVALAELRLSDMVYPEVTRLPEYPWSYLVVITPVAQTVVTWSDIGGWVRRAGTVAILFLLLDRILLKVFGDGVVGLLFSLFR